MRGGQAAILNKILGSNILQDYCILHGWQGLPQHLPSDLDIVVSQDNLFDLEKVLLNLPDAKLVQLLQHESSCYFFVLTIKDGPAYKFVQVDAAIDYRRNGLVFFTAEELMAGRRQWNGFWVAPPEVEFKYLLVKKVLKERVPPHQKQRFPVLVHELQGKAEEIADVLLGRRWGPQVITWITSGDWQTFEAKLQRLRRALLWQKVKQDPLNSLRYWLPEIKRIVRRLRYPTGLLVVVLGPDGAGKSTLISNLQEQLKGAFRRTTVFHLRPYLFGKKGNGAPVTDPHGKPVWSRLVSVIKIIYYLFDYTLGYLFKVRLKLAMSTLVLFDRYYDDLLVDPWRYRYGGPMLLARFARRLIPRPDLFLTLDLPVDELLIRKREVSREELARQRQTYLKLALELRNSIIIDGRLPPEQLAKVTSDAVIDHLHARYLGRRSIWFGSEEWSCFSWATDLLNGRLDKCHGNVAFAYLRLPEGRGYLFPVNKRTAVAKSLSLYSPQRRGAQFVKKLLTAGANLGLTQKLLPNVQLGGLENFKDYLAYIFDCTGIQFAISLGMPGPQCKPVLQVMDRNAKILGYMKIGWDVITRELVENEKRALEDLGRYTFERILFPNVIHYGMWHERSVLITSAIQLMKNKSAEQVRDDHIRCLEELCALGFTEESFAQSAFWTATCYRIEQLKNVIPSYQTHSLKQAKSLLENHFGSTRLPFVWRLGDFTPWNVSMHRTGKFAIIDLEYARRKWLPGWDLFHYFRASSRLDKIQENVIGRDQRQIWEYFENLGIRREAVPLLRLAYFVDLFTDWRIMWYRSGRRFTRGSEEVFRGLARTISYLITLE